MVRLSIPFPGTLSKQCSYNIIVQVVYKDIKSLSIYACILTIAHYQLALCSKSAWYMITGAIISSTWPKSLIPDPFPELDGHWSISSQKTYMTNEKFTFWAPIKVTCTCAIATSPAGFMLASQFWNGQPKVTLFVPLYFFPLSHKGRKRVGYARLIRA